MYSKEIFMEPFGLLTSQVRLPHTSQFFVTTNRVQAWGRVDLRHVGKDACLRDSHDNSSLVEVRASPDKLS